MNDVSVELEAMDNIIARLRPYLMQTNAERAHAQSLIRTQLDISYILCRALDIDEALSQCVERIVRNTPYDAGAIYLLEPDGSYQIALEYKMPHHLMGRFPRFTSDSHAVHFTTLGDAYFGSYATFMAMIDEPVDVRYDAERQLALVPMMSHRGTEGALVMLADAPFDCDDPLRNALSSIASNMASSVARIRAMHALRESTVQLQLMSDHAGDGIAITNKGVVVRSNNTLAHWLGIDSEIMQGEPINRFIQPHTPSAYRLVALDGTILDSVDCTVHRLNRVNGYEDCAVWIVRVAPQER